MPELPEVETTRRGIRPHIQGHTVQRVVIRQPKLRWPVCPQLPEHLQGQRIMDVSRRGKYLLLSFEHGTVLWHLGMSGSLRIINDDAPHGKHDHVEWELSNGQILRFNDPRRFGAVVWTEGPAYEHPLLHHLGPEPLSDLFDGDYLFSRSRRRTVAVKSWLMDSKTVVGVGNIYANEALFASAIHPLKKTRELSRPQCDRLVQNVKRILTYAIERGGTTLRDFVGGDGKPGYFAQELAVYGRGGQPCRNCTKPLTERHLTQRSTVYCTVCQKR